MDNTFPEPAIWDFIKSKGDAIKPLSGQTIDHIPGLRESVFVEFILLLRKFNYCRTVMLNSALNGFPTWSIIAAYDACFYGARAFCSLLGIASAGRHSKIYIDLFKPVTFKTGKKGKKSTSIEIEFLALGSHLTHETLWSLTARLARTLSMPDGESKEKLRILSKFDMDGVSNIRNNIIYDGGHWAFNSMNEDCDLVLRLGHISTSNALLGRTDLEKDENKYYQLSEHLGALLNFFISDIAQIAPGLRSEVAAMGSWRSDNAFRGPAASI